jgi:hypothetical protein
MFEVDLQVGKSVEQDILKLIQKKHPDAYIIDGYCKEWDIFIPSLNIGVEVKSDKKSQYTGNIVIEIEFNGKPSALSTTKASYWVFVLPSIIITTPDIIRNVISTLRPVRFIGKGDVAFKTAYLVKKELLISTRILTCDLFVQ